MAILIISLYTVLMAFIFLHSTAQLILLINSWQFKRRTEKDKSDTLICTNWPRVTIQLPIYNEKYVVERLLQCITQIQYPNGLLDIQVLDDSTDETKEIAAQCIEQLQAQGHNIHHVLRPTRVGYKAGALAYGMEFAEGEFIAIFDADFLPEPTFLFDTMPHFINENIGLVQTKWGHINKHQNLLTKLQAFGLDAHFTIEQTGRNLNKHFINFNGTAGIWRKKCILDAGGWSADTLTEDLDLSYRAQLKSWEFVYLPNIVCKAELPFDILPLKSQQYRWTKGAAECLVKNMLNVFKSRFSISTKLHAFFHLANSFVFVALFMASVLSLPLLYIKITIPETVNYFLFANVFSFGFLFLMLYYFSAYLQNRDKEKGDSLFAFLFYFPMFLAASMGISWHNSVAVISGYLGKKSPFVRTPKFNAAVSSKKTKLAYASYGLTVSFYVELALLVYFLGALFLAVTHKEYVLVFFHGLLALGFGFVSFAELKSKLR